MTQADTDPWFLFVRFEQGRGQGGVPKTWVPYMVQADAKPQIETLVRMAVQLLRAQCADPMSHGRDLMPGDDEEYQLHHLDGARITDSGQIRWELHPKGWQRAEVVLTWGNPADKLMSEVRG